VFPGKFMLGSSQPVARWNWPEWKFSCADDGKCRL